MTLPMPPDFTEIQRARAELADLRWVALHLLQEHRRGAYPHPCLCPVCRAAARWVQLPENTTRAVTRRGLTIPHPGIRPAKHPIPGGFSLPVFAPSMPGDAPLETADLSCEATPGRSHVP